jgi:leader peptidase (prepilin peptidase)/N-methyltransferase
VASAVFKTVVSARKRRKVGSIPTRLRQRGCTLPYNRLSMQLLLEVYAFALGAIIGSFLNVVIHRYPRSESIVFPASHCPNCNAPIRGYDNIPIVSFLVLAGRCRNCRVPISPRYLLIELANALFYLAIYQRMAVSVGSVLVAAIVSMTIVLIFIDLEIQILPDVIDLPGVAIGMIIGALALGSLHPALTLAVSWRDSLLGAVVGALVLLAIALSYRLIRKIEGMGMGDVKMMAMIGATLGWEPLLAVLLIASISGAVIGIAVAMNSEKGMQVALPFGVFLGFAFLAVIFFGQLMVHWLPAAGGLG